MPSTNVFKELCIKTTLLRSTPKNSNGGYVMRYTSSYESIYCILIHQIQMRDFMAPIIRGMPNKRWLFCPPYWKPRVAETPTLKVCEISMRVMHA